MVDSVWGVLDFVADTNYPDIRSLSVVQSTAGTILLIPRESDMIRLYIPLEKSDATDLIDPTTGRVHKDRTSPEKLIEQAQKVFSPYRISIKDGLVDWWTVYVGRCLWCVMSEA